MRALLALLFALTVLPATAQQPATSAESPTAEPAPRLLATGERAVDPTVLELHQLDRELQALMRDLRVARANEFAEAIEANRLTVLALQERYDTARLPGERLAIDREIERVKFEGEVRLMQIQVEYARLAGHDDVAAAIEAEIDTMRELRAASLPNAVQE